MTNHGEDHLADSVQEADESQCLQDLDTTSRLDVLLCRLRFQSESLEDGPFNTFALHRSIRCPNIHVARMI